MGKFEIFFTVIDFVDGIEAGTSPKSKSYLE